MGNCVHVRGPGQFSEEGFRTLDKVIEVARRKGVRVIIPFVDQAKWWGGIGEYAAFRGKAADEFWTDRQLIDDFKKTIRFLLTRKNTYTGVEYRNEPAIFGWETGNEIKATSEWMREIAAYLKELDRQHLVIDGNSLHGVPQESLDDPNVDVITTHHYPFGEDHDFAKLILPLMRQLKGKSHTLSASSVSLRCRTLQVRSTRWLMKESQVRCYGVCGCIAARVDFIGTWRLAPAAIFIKRFTGRALPPAIGMMRAKC